MPSSDTSTAVAAPSPEPGTTATSSTTAARPRSRADELARRLLRIDTEVPGALVPMRGSLLLSAVRCVLTYVVIPVLVPVVGWLAPLAAPLSLALTLVAGAMAITSLRRVWAADWEHRWAYTAFAAVVLLALAGLLVIDVLAVLR